MSDANTAKQRPRYASAQEAARVAAEAAQIIRRNEAENETQREVLAHAKSEINRHLSLEREPVVAAARMAENLDAVIHASDCATHNPPSYAAGDCDCGARSVATSLNTFNETKPTFDGFETNGA